ncbi:hypothetical protein ACOMHN_055461 [Nucella lapillus]
MRRLGIRGNLVLVLLLGIFTLNLCIFLTLQPSIPNDSVYPKDVSLELALRQSAGVSHLQFPRKRLNKSNYTSDSLGADPGVAMGAGVGAGLEERGKDRSPPAVVRRAGKARGVKSGGELWGRRRAGDSPRVRPRNAFRHDPDPQDKRTLEDEGGGGGGGEGVDDYRQDPGSQNHHAEPVSENQHADPVSQNQHADPIYQNQEVDPVPQKQLERLRARNQRNPAEQGNNPAQNAHLATLRQTAQEDSPHHAQNAQPPGGQAAAKDPPHHGAQGARGGFEGNAGVRNFTDLGVDALVVMLDRKGMLDLDPEQGLQENYWAFLKRHRLRRHPGPPLPAYRNYRARTWWERFHKGIRRHVLYDPDSPVTPSLMDDLAHRKIVDVEEKEGGTQLKLVVGFDNAGQALFKPMRFPRETETLPNHFYFADYERHIAEIAAFHLDRALGYNRVPPTVGRWVNMTQDIRDLADNKLARTFFISPAGNLCFHGSCSYYCDSSHPVCGHPDHLEASLMAFLPSDTLADRLTWRNPWKRSYSKRRKAYWEAYDDLCVKIRRRPPYSSGRRLLDIMDMAVLDFLMGNLDRHHYETFESFGNDTFILHLDNGRGFGKQNEDELSCLAPLVQCCMIRLSTLQRLARLYGGHQPLSQVMKESMASDQVGPVLIEGHLRALDRRVVQVLKAVKTCLDQGGKTLTQVIVDDGVY